MFTMVTTIFLTPEASTVLSPSVLLDGGHNHSVSLPSSLQHSSHPCSCSETCLCPRSKFSHYSHDLQWENRKLSHEIHRRRDRSDLPLLFVSVNWSVKGKLESPVALVGDKWGVRCCSQLTIALFSEICSLRGPRILTSTRFSAFLLMWMFFPGSVWKKNFRKYCFLFWDSFPGSPAPPFQCWRLLMLAPTFLYYA